MNEKSNTKALSIWVNVLALICVILLIAGLLFLNLPGKYLGFWFLAGLVGLAYSWTLRIREPQQVMHPFVLDKKTTASLGISVFVFTVGLIGALDEPFIFLGYTVLALIADAVILYILLQMEPLKESARKSGEPMIWWKYLLRTLAAILLANTALIGVLVLSSRNHNGMVFLSCGVLTVFMLAGAIVTRWKHMTFTTMPRLIWGFVIMAIIIGGGVTATILIKAIPASSIGLSIVISLLVGILTAFLFSGA